MKLTVLETFLPE